MTVIRGRFTFITCFVLLGFAELSFAQKMALQCKDPVEKKTSCSLKKQETKVAIQGDAAAIKKECEKQSVSLEFAKAAAAIGAIYPSIPTENSLKQEIEYFEATIERLIKRREVYLLFKEKFEVGKANLEAEKKAANVTVAKLIAAYNKEKDLAKKYKIQADYEKFFESSIVLNLGVPKNEAQLAETLKYYDNEITEVESKVTKKKAQLAELIASKEKGDTSGDKKLIEKVTIALAEDNHSIEKGSKFRDCGLTAEEIAAIHWYSGNMYQAINHALRFKDPERNKTLQPVVDAINSGLEKLKPVKALVKRGADLPEQIANQHCMGCVVVYDAFTSTSTSSDQAFDASSMFAIKSKTGRYIAPLSPNQEEEEVLFKSGTKFKVTAIKKQKDGTTHYTMEEVE